MIDELFYYLMLLKDGAEGPLIQWKQILILLSGFYLMRSNDGAEGPLIQWKQILLWLNDWWIVLLFNEIKWWGRRPIDSMETNFEVIEWLMNCFII